LDSLSIVVPAYNEARRLPATLEKLCRFLQSSPMRDKEIVVVNDGSTDETAEIARAFSRREPMVRLLENPGNCGKGYAVRAGFRQACCEWVLFSDADLSTPIEDLARLEAAIARSGADGAIGSRGLDRKLVGKRQPAVREISGRMFNLFVRLVTGLPYRDTQCGFKLFRRDVAQALAARQRLDGFGFDVEILYIARRLGYRIEEVAVQWDDAAGTKVSLWKGLAAFGDPVRVRCNDLQGRYR
jgi:glycosyltransferase involved in cell wall biosynthesis